MDGESTLLWQLAARLECTEGEPSAPDQELLLEIAGEVAHNSERKQAPLATYLIGRYVEARRVAGVAEATALNEARQAVLELTSRPPAPVPPGPPEN